MEELNKIKMNSSINALCVASRRVPRIKPRGHVPQALNWERRTWGYWGYWGHRHLGAWLPANVITLYIFSLMNIGQ